MTDQPSGWSEVLGGLVVSIFLAVAVSFSLFDGRD